MERSPTNSPPDFASMSLEELMDYPVTSVTRTERKWSDSHAAIHVVTQEDIRRSGVTSIPDALRLAPGVQVGRVNAHTWAVSARGFNDVFANKLLVLQDGRSIYTPLFSGVFWEVQDTLLEDIDRIEVIRGPGATLWGANAVNGVINIITKSARDTQGLLVTGGAGTEERGFGGVRYGGALSSNAFFRVYGKYLNRDDSLMAGGREADDDWHMGRGGFRVDWEAGARNQLTLQGDVYGGELEEVFSRLSPVTFTTNNVRDRFEVAGGNLLGRWTHTLGVDASLALQAYYDRTFRDTVIFREDRDTVDVDFQHTFPLGGRQQLIWGLGYRLTQDEIRDSDDFDISLDPSSRSSHLFSAFVQDEITLVRDRLTLTLGSKFEHNDFTGFEFQPSARLLWTPDARHTLWGAVSRAVRTPSRAEEDVRLNQPAPPGSPAPVVSIFGNRDFDSEKLLALELGYRVQALERLTLDVAAFYNDYEDLRSLDPRNPPFGFPPPHLAFEAGNHLEGETYGVELAPTWQATDWWRWRLAYSYLQIQVHRRSAATTPDTELLYEGSSPHHQLTLSSSLDLPANFGFDATLRYVDELPALAVGRYVVVDLRLSWRPRPNLEISLTGQNLLDSQHAEFVPTTITVQATEVPHGVYGKITWHY